MSFILDALKKLEREKAARRNGTVDISQGILREDRNPRRKGRRSPLLIVVVSLVLVLLVGGVVGTVLFRDRGGAVHEARNTPSASVSRQETTSRPEPPAKPVPAVADAVPVAPAPVPESPSSRPALGPGQGKAAGGPPAAPAAAAAPDDGSAEYCQGGPPSSGSELKVSGIAWQQNRSARRAVINDVLMPEGSVVGSYTVREIFRNRVCFESGGRTYSVYISGPVLGDTPPPLPSRTPGRAILGSNRPPVRVNRAFGRTRDNREAASVR